MKFTRKKVIILIAFALLTFGGIYLTNLSNSISEYYSINWVSYSIRDSKLKRSFVRELKINPKEFEKDKMNIKFNECWIEKQTRIKYSWLFFSKYYETGKYRLCFTLKNKLLGNTLPSHFFIDQNKKSFGRMSSVEKEVFERFIDKNSKNKIKISLVKSFDELWEENAVIELN